MTGSADRPRAAALEAEVPAGASTPAACSITKASSALNTRLSLTAGGGYRLHANLNRGRRSPPGSWLAAVSLGDGRVAVVGELTGSVRPALALRGSLGPPSPARPAGQHWRRTIRRVRAGASWPGVRPAPTPPRGEACPLSVKVTSSKGTGSEFVCDGGVPSVSNGHPRAPEGIRSEHPSAMRPFEACTKDSLLIPILLLQK